MKNNKNRYATLLILSILFNFILVLFYFPSNRIKVKFFVMKIFGFSAPGSTPRIVEDVLLTDFQPNSVLKNEDKRNQKMPNFPVIETHGHLGRFFQTKPEEVSKQLDQFGIQYFINLSFTTGEKYIDLKKEYSDPRIIHFSSFGWRKIKESTEFVPEILKDLKMDIQNGSKGIKLWKDFGLLLKKPDGTRLKMDDPILDPLFEECARNGLVISIHTSDPPAFFNPIDSKNERYEELLRHPEWSFHGPEFPDFSTVLEERERLFQRHPKLRFVALHFAELAHDLDKADELLTRNPNVYFDIAARIDELGRQPGKTRNFLLKWQDRILFGTDGPPDSGKLEIYSRFLETSDDYFDYYPAHKSRKGFWKIYGIHLPAEVLEKIYFKNAKKLFGLK